jgi:hypothetical protein
VQDYWILPSPDGSLSFNSSINNGGNNRSAARDPGVHTTRNFSASARSLGVSTSAVSAAVARLEQKLAVRLLNECQPNRVQAKIAKFFDA